jgi:uncharacterized protein YecT (DUF1311 family)
VNRLKFAALIFAALAPPAGANAESLDCAKASARREKLTCSSPELTKLNRDMTAAYQRALAQGASVGRQRELKREQRRWLKTRADPCSDAACLAGAYQERTVTLDYDARLNEAYATLIDHFDKGAEPGRKSALRLAQEDWTRFRDANCRYYSLEYQAGARASVAYSSCVLQLTKERADELEAEIGRQLD